MKMKDAESCAHKPEGEEGEEAGDCGESRRLGRWLSLALNFPDILAYTLDLHI